MLTRDFTVATFVIHQQQVLLLWHRKLQMWLPPGGHVDANELPDDAAVREVREESGITCQLVGEKPLPVEYPRQLVRPAGIQLETITAFPAHEHIDLIYFAKVAPGTDSTPKANDESEQIGWFTLSQLQSMNVAQDVQRWTALAMQAVQ